MKKVIFSFLFWAISIYLIVIFLPQSIGLSYTYEHDIGRPQPPSVLWHLANFDGVHYLNISQHRYFLPFQAAFFPLYPLVIRIISFLTLGNFFLASLITSLAFSFFTGILIYKIGGKKALILLLAFPTSFFLLASYTESLFLFLFLASWYFYKQKKFFLMGIFGALATAARFYGILLIPTIIIDFLTQNKRPKIHKIWPILLFPIGLFSYMIFLKIRFNDPLMFFHGLSLWQKSQLVFPLQTIYRYIKIFITVSPSVYQFWVAIFEFVSLSFGLTISLIYLSRKQYAFFILLILGVLIPASTGTLQSLPRYILSLFPIFLLPITRYKLYFYVIIGFTLQLLLLGLFLNGYFVS